VYLFNIDIIELNY